MRKQLCLLTIAILLVGMVNLANATTIDLGSSTTYSDNYNTNPLADPENTPFWSYSTVTWNSDNHRLQNSYSLNQTEVVYCLTHDGAITGADIRLTSTDAEPTATAAFAINGGANIRVAIATEADGTYTDIYSGSWVQTQASNPGGYADLSSYENLETLFVRIYSTPSDTNSHYIYWSGFQVELDAVPEPATMAIMALGSIIVVRRKNKI